MDLFILTLRAIQSNLYIVWFEINGILQVMNSSTPSHIQITPRNPEFNFEGLDHTWMDDIYKRHFLYSLSIFIPFSERCVSDILRAQLADITDEKLKHDVQAFIKQEARHGRLHLEINNRLKQHYKGLGILEAIQKRFVNIARKVFGKRFELAMPVAFEHFTATVSREILTNRKEWLDKDNDLTHFVLWHCLEELEHQSVCIDAFHSKYKSPWPIILSLALFWAPISFTTISFSFLLLLLQQGHFKKPINIIKALRFMTKNHGLFFGEVFKYKHHSPEWKDADKALYNASLKHFNRAQDLKQSNY